MGNDSEDDCTGRDLEPDPSEGDRTESTAGSSNVPDLDDRRRHSWPGSPEWPVVESAVEYATGWVTAGYDLVEHPDGTTKRYYWAELPTAVVVVARTDDRVVFVDQYRPTIRETQLELPAGVVEKGESFTAAGSRELREETGLAPDSTTLLQEVWCTTGLLRHRRAFVYAQDLRPVEQSLDASEFLQIRAVPVGEVVERVRQQPTNDATVEGILLAREEGLL